MLVKTYTSGFHSFWCSGAPSAFACQQPVFNYTKVLVSLLPGIIMAVCIAVAKSTNQLALCQWHIPKAVNMKSWLQLNGLWHLVSGSDKKPAAKPEIEDSSGTILSQAVPLDKDKLEALAATAVHHSLLDDAQSVLTPVSHLVEVHTYSLE